MRPQATIVFETIPEWPQFDSPPGKLATWHEDFVKFGSSRMRSSWMKRRSGTNVFLSVYFTEHTYNFILNMIFVIKYGLKKKKL